MLYQSNSTRTREEHNVVDGNKLNSVLEFTYLGSTISSNGCTDDEIQANASFGRQRQTLWNNHNVSMRVKCKIYHAIVLSTFLYGAEAGTVYRRQVKKLHAFMVRHLRSIVRIINLDGQSDKQGNTRTDRAAICGRFSYQKESPVDWTPHEDVTRWATKATVFWSQQHRAPFSPVQGYHQEKPEAERHKDQLMDISLSQQRDKWRAIVK